MPEFITFSLVLDIALVSLLASLLFIGIRLDKKIRWMRQYQDEINTASKIFQDSTNQAFTAISTLKLEVDATINMLEAQQKKATNTQQDLNFLIEKAEKSADGLEAVLRAVRKQSQKSAATALHVENTEEKPSASLPASKAERELLAALKNAR